MTNMSKLKASSKQSNILLLTATITPPAGVPLLQRSNPQERLQDYEKALKFYLTLLNQSLDAIVFAENSASDISVLRGIVEQAGITNQVEFLVFDGLDHPPNYGRAYGEFKLINYVMKHSQIINGQEEDITVWKVTGRYIVNNLSQIITNKPASFDIYCNCRNIPKQWADMFLIAWTNKGYKAFLENIHHKLIADPDQIIQPEEFFWDLLAKPTKDIKFARRFNVIPLIDGVRGSDNQNYSQGPNLLKFYLRSIGCKLFPWLWI
jgi:hypothetical protein